MKAQLTKVKPASAILQAVSQNTDSPIKAEPPEKCAEFILRARVQACLSQIGFRVVGIRL
jgi:hypothetical protein